MEGARRLHPEREQHAYHGTATRNDVSVDRYDSEVRIDAEDDKVGDDRREEVTE